MFKYSTIFKDSDEAYNFANEVVNKHAALSACVHEVLHYIITDTVGSDEAYEVTVLCKDVHVVDKIADEINSIVDPIATWCEVHTTKYTTAELDSWCNK